MSTRDLSTRRQQLKDALDRVGLLGATFAARRLVEIARPRIAVGNIRTWRARHDGLPVPPLSLIYAVAGHFDRDGFLHTGRDNFEDITRALGTAGVELTRDEMRVLDFGCGCGRVLRHWHSFDNIEAHGVDPNPKLVDWCRSNLPFASVRRNHPRPPLAFEDDSLDAIYAISVFTHLDVDAQDQWIKELTRVLAPGGHFVVTTHGAAAAQRLGRSLQRSLEDVGVVVLHARREGSNVCATYHSESYMRERFAPGLQLLGFQQQGLRWSTQDITIFRKS